MFIHERRAWEGASVGRVTPEGTYLSRRQFVAAMGLGTIGARGIGDQRMHAVDAVDPVERAGHGPFVEYGADRDVARERARCFTGLRQVRIGGLVRRPIVVDVDELVRRFSLEERTYRFRCVEGWAMVVPWVGISMRALVEWCEPKSAAKYVRFVGRCEPEGMKGIGEQPWYRWPYVEGLRIDEAVNELTFLATGVYGRSLSGEEGAPVRLVVPWKYGHKSIKGIARIEFVAERPGTFWNSALPFEYSFEGNVDPGVRHPRWSQEYEAVMGTRERVRTQIYNGYGASVSVLYS